MCNPNSLDPSTNADTCTQSKAVSFKGTDKALPSPVNERVGGEIMYVITSTLLAIQVVHLSSLTAKNSVSVSTAKKSVLVIV